jgi:hypothetical protein
MNWTEFNEAISHFAEPAYVYAAAIAVTLVLILILILLVRRQPNNIVAYRTENGRVMICRSAIVELVRTSCDQLDDIAKPSVKIHVKGKYTHFDVRVQLMSGGRLKDIERTLQAHLREGLSENLGIENIGKINIVATGFKSGRIKISSPITAKEKSSTITMDGADEFDLSDLEPLEKELGQKQL